MHPYSEDQILSILNRFHTQKLSKKEWTHDAHLMVAIWYCSKYTFYEALDNVRTHITLHNESVGTPNSNDEGYHETITRFWLIVASNFIQTSSHASLAEKCNAFIASDLTDSKAPLKYYSTDLLYSTKARKRWVDPDLIPHIL